MISFERINIEDTDFEEGDRVVFLESVDRYNNASIDKGETGKVEADKDGQVEIRMDKHHPELNGWSNRSHVYDHDGIEELLAKVVAKGIVITGTRDHVVMEEFGDSTSFWRQ